MDTSEITQLLRNNETFAGAGLETLEAMVAAGSLAHLEEGDFLLTEGKLGEALWVLLTGEVSVHAGHDVVNRISRPGEIIGEIGAVSQTPATATVRCQTAVDVYRIPQKELHRAMAGSPQLAAAVLRSMAKYLGRR